MPRIRIGCSFFKTYLDSSLDKTRPPGSQILKPTKLGTKFAKLQHNIDPVVDIWREFNSSNRDYTFYSHVHLMYSWIDHVFTSTTSLPLCSSKILETTRSHHSPVVVLLFSLRSPTASFNWRLNESHFSNQATCLDTEIAFKEYFSLNDQSHTSSMCTLAANKAMILIQTAARYKKLYRALLKQK